MTFDCERFLANVIFERVWLMRGWTHFNCVELDSIVEGKWHLQSQISERALQLVIGFTYECADVLSFSAQHHVECTMTAAGKAYTAFRYEVGAEKFSCFIKYIDSGELNKLLTANNNQLCNHAVVVALRLIFDVLLHNLLAEIVMFS